MTDDMDPKARITAEMKVLVNRLKDLNEAALHASIDLTQDPKWIEDRQRVLDRAKELGFPLPDDVNARLEAYITNPEQQEASDRAFGELEEAYVKAPAYMRARAEGKSLQQIAVEDELRRLKKEQEQLRLKDFLPKLQELLEKVDWYFQLKDLPEIVEWCLNGEYTLEAAIRAVGRNKPRTLHLIYAANGELHGVFLNKTMADHYVEQYGKNGELVQLVEAPLADYVKPVALQVWSFDLATSSVPIKVRKFYTFNPNQFVTPLAWKYGDGDRVHLTYTKMEAVIPAEDETAVPEFVARVRGEFDFIEHPNETYTLRKR